MLEERTKKYKLIMWGIIYWIALTGSFVWALQVRHESIFLIDFSVVKYIVATITVITMLAAIPNNVSSVSLSITIILYMVVFPIAIVYACQDRESLYYISVFFCMIAVELFIRYVSANLVRLRDGGKNTTKRVMTFVWVFLGLTVLVMCLERGVPSLSSLDFSITYIIRSSYELSSLASRLFNFAAKAIIPFLIAVYFIKKKYKIVCLLLLVQFFFFLWLANKATLFSIGVMAIGYLVGKSQHGELLFSKITSLGMIGISIIQYYNIEAEAGLSLPRIIDYAYSIIVRRALILPAYLKYSYYDYFVNLDNSHMWLFGTFIAPILTRLGVHNPYETIPYTRVIGDNYYMGSNANTGLFGAELAHFGYLGIFIAGLLLIIFLICIKKCELTNGKVFTCCLTIYTVTGLADAGIIQLIDFSPMLLIALIAYFYEISEHETEAERKKGTGVLHKRIRFKLRGSNGSGD